MKPRSKVLGGRAYQICGKVKAMLQITSWRRRATAAHPPTRGILENRPDLPHSACCASGRRSWAGRKPKLTRQPAKRRHGSQSKFRSPQQAPVARPRWPFAARLIENGTRIAKFHVSNLLPREQKTGRHIPLRRALACVPVLFMRSLCEPYRTTVPQLCRATMRLVS